MSDPRFTRLKTDPRFRKAKRKHVEHDADERFKTSRLDEINSSFSRTHKRSRLGNDRDFEDDSTFESSRQTLPDFARGEVLLESSDEDDENDVPNELRQVTKDAEKKSGGSPLSDSNGKGTLDIDLDETSDIYAELDAQAVEYAKQTALQDEPEVSRTTKTNRLAIVNLDWDHIRASHLYRIVSSLLSPTGASSDTPLSKSNEKFKGLGHSYTVGRGQVQNVCVYASDFGKERMQREEREGPPKELFEVPEGGNTDEIRQESLRKYQLERLRYYYAIITCDTVDAADHIMSELDGTELERTANVFDISFVPDDMSFDDHPRDEATSVTDLSFSQKTLDFSTDALSHSKVSITWDEDDPERDHLTRRKMTLKDIEEENFESYVALSSSDEASDHPSSETKQQKADRGRLRELLLGYSNRKKKSEVENVFGTSKTNGDVEITFAPGLSTNLGELDKEETTMDTYKRKRKEARSARESKRNLEPARSMVDDDFFVQGNECDTSIKAELKSKRNLDDNPLENEVMETQDGGTQMEHFDFKQILRSEKAKGKGKKRKGSRKAMPVYGEVQKDFKIDTTDERFDALREDYAFAIDPSNPHFKKTKDMVKLLRAQSKRGD